MTEREAKAIVDEAWRRLHGRSPSPRESLFAQAIARLETGYGRSGQFAAMAARGAFNWGALERAPNADGSCPAGTEPGRDNGGDVCFFAFPSDVDAATAFLHVLTGTSGRTGARGTATLAAMRSGSAKDVARAMRTSPAYYTGAVGSEAQKQNAYAVAIERNADVIRVAVGGPDVRSAGAPIGAFVGAGLLAAAAYVYIYGVPPPIANALPRGWAAVFR